MAAKQLSPWPEKGPGNPERWVTMLKSLTRPLGPAHSNVVLDEIRPKHKDRHLK